MRRRRAWAVAVAGCIVSVVLGAVIVRVGLAISDARPYEGATTERYYLMVLAAALLMWWGGSAVSVIVAVRYARNKPNNAV